MEPWTRRIRVKYRPLVSFYERRVELLRTLEDEGLVRQFWVREDQTALRLKDPQHVLVFGSNELDIGALSQDADTEMLSHAVQVVWEALSPKPSRSTSVNFQWLIPIDAPYDDARTAASKMILEPPEGIGLVDFAVLLDGKTDVPSAEFNGQAGIVESAEIPPRFSMKFSDADRNYAPPSLWSEESLPDVAIYAAQDWVVNEEVRTSDEMFELWARMMDKSAKLTEALQTRLFRKGME